MAAPTKQEDWLRLQKLIFARYVNQKFRQEGKIGPKQSVVNDVVTDFRNGVTLIEFAELLSGKTFPGKRPAVPKNKIGQIDVCKAALDFIKKDCGINVQASAEDLVNGAENFVLGMVFQIILKYLKFEEEDEGQSTDVKEALKLWLKNKVADHKEIIIENFTKSFHDGLAFCALIHKMRPKLIPYETLKREDKIGNLTLALNTAAKYLNIEKYLEPTDIAKLDEVGMIVYLTDWYYGVSLLQKQDIAARRIAKLATMTELHDKMKADYTSGAKNLTSWIDNKISSLNGTTFDNTLAGIRSRLDAFYEYKNTEKSAKIVEQLDLSALFNNLAIRLHNNKRPAFKPADSLTLQAIDSKFGQLENAEVETSKRMHAELARQIKLHNMAKRLRSDADILTKLIQEQIAYFEAKESIDSVELAEYALETHAHHMTETSHLKESRFKEISKVAAELYQEKFENSSEIQGLESNLTKAFATAVSCADAKKKTLQAELENQKAINDKLCSQFATLVKAFGDWLQKKKYLLSANKDAELEQQLNDVNNSTKDHSEANTKLEEIKAADAKVKARQIANNPHTNVTLGDVMSQWTQYQVLLKKKKELLEQQIEEKKKSGLSEEQLAEIKDNFEYFDKNKSGYLDRRELRGALTSLGEEASKAAVDTVMKTYDKDGDGKIVYEEFKHFMFTKLGDTNSIDEIRTSFNYISLHNDFVTLEQLETVVNEVSFRTKHVEYLKKEMKPKGSGFDWPKWVQEVFDR